MDTPTNFIEGLLARVHGPMTFRFFLQPLTACYFAYRDGKRDAQEGKPPFLWGLLTSPEHRGAMLMSSCKSVGKVFVFAVVLDLVFQYFVFHKILFRGGALMAGVVLALIPYALLRGPVNRLALRKQK